jgi:hypothetical protein
MAFFEIKIFIEGFKKRWGVIFFLKLPEYLVFSARYQLQNFILFLILVAGTKYILKVFKKKKFWPVFELLVSVLYQEWYFI